MVARSIQAFMSFENITHNLKLLINHEILQSPSQIKKNHNFAHGILIQFYNVLCNYLKIREQINIINVFLFIYINFHNYLKK